MTPTQRAAPLLRTSSTFLAVAPPSTRLPVAPAFRCRGWGARACLRPWHCAALSVLITHLASGGRRTRGEPCVPSNSLALSRRPLPPRLLWCLPRLRPHQPSTSLLSRRHHLHNLAVPSHCPTTATVQSASRRHLHASRGALCTAPFQAAVRLTVLRGAALRRAGTPCICGPNIATCFRRESDHNPCHCALARPLCCCHWLPRGRAVARAWRRGSTARAVARGTGGRRRQWTTCLAAPILW